MKATVLRNPGREKRSSVFFNTVLLEMIFFLCLISLAKHQWWVPLNAALESAGFLAGFGLDVIVTVHSILLHGFDQEMAEKVGSYMEKHGVKFLRQLVSDGSTVEGMLTWKAESIG